MTLTEFFEQGYFYFLVTGFGFLLVLGTFIISFIRTQKLPLIQLIITCVFLFLNFFKPLLIGLGLTPLSTGGMSYDLIIVILSAILILGDHVVYLLFTSGNLSRKSLFVLAPLKTGRKIYLYLDHKGKASCINTPLYDKLELPEESRNLKKVAQNYVFEGNYVYGEFLKKLNLAEDGIVEFTIQLEDKDVKFQLEKITIKETIKDEEQVIGSIFVELEGECCENEEPVEDEELVAEPEEEAAPACGAQDPEEEPQEEQPEEQSEEEQSEEEPQEEQSEEEQPEEEPQEEPAPACGTQDPEETPAEEEPQEEQPEEEPQEEQPEEEPQEEAAPACGTQDPEEAPAEEAQEEQPEEQPQEEPAPACGAQDPEEAQAEEPQEEQPEEQPEEEAAPACGAQDPEEAPVEEPQEEQPEEQPQEEPAPACGAQDPEEAPAEEAQPEEGLSMDELNKVDLDNSFLDDDEEK